MLGPLVVDGGLKAHRQICAAKLHGIREFKSGAKVVTGCTRHPGGDSKFCWEHKNTESPIIDSDKISSRTRSKLRDHRTETTGSKEAGQDNMYIIESILDVSEDKTKYCIKWLGFPEDQSLWEDESVVPGFIAQYYNSDRTRLGKKLPNPKIKATKQVGDSTYHLLSFEGEAGRDWLHEDLFKVLDEYGEETLIEIESSCNTRKSRDKRERRHTVGIFVGRDICTPKGFFVLGYKPFRLISQYQKVFRSANVSISRRYAMRNNSVI